MDIVQFAENSSILGILELLAGLYVAQFLCQKLYWTIFYPRFFSPLRHLPGPKDHYFFVGQGLNQFQAKSPNEPYVSWARQWPEAPLIRYFGFANSEAVLVTGLGALREVSQTKCYSFEKPSFFIRLLEPIVGYGMLFAGPEEHRKRRKGFNVFFSPNNLRSIIPMLERKARNLSSLLNRAIDDGSNEIELVGTFSKIMLDIMGNFALGVELNYLEASSGSRMSFHQSYHEIFDPDTVGLILIALDVIVPVRWLPLEANRKFKTAINTIRNEMGAVIKKRIKEVGDWNAENGGVDMPQSKDMLTFVVKEKYFADRVEERWTEKDILNELLAFLAAGHETTASALVWAVHSFTKYPEITAKLRDEIDILVKDRPDPEYSDIESLRYLNNFSRELLRFYTPSVQAPREASEDVMIQGVRIPKGTTVLMIPTAIHRNPAIWGEACDVFDPDRWDALEGTPAADPLAFAPFIAGPRACIGKGMTMIEFKIIVVELLRRFDFDTVGDPQREIELMNPSVLLRPKGGLRVKVKKRVS